MSEYAVIVQNDESEWDDVKGDQYHYPSRYRKILTEGCQIVYYKGSMKKKEYLPHRLSPVAHYFGIGTIGDSIVDPGSSKNDRFCQILDYREFKQPVLIKRDGKYIENIPESKKNNYWRNGVGQISAHEYESIVSTAAGGNFSISLPNENNELESYRVMEGSRKVRFSAYYERKPFYRAKAIEIHGLSCMACGFNFQKVYGDIGKGFIHVHHNTPISESDPGRPNPRTDLSVVCPNCHAMIHKDKNHTLSVDDLKKLRAT